jgi:phenylpropionate dioxygenase-like ring-hydroxylating dioxygenase large terminal subunit
MVEDIILFRSGEGSAGALEDPCCHRGVKFLLGTAIKKNAM